MIYLTVKVLIVKIRILYANIEKPHTLGNKCCTGQKGRDYWNTKSGKCNTVIVRLQQVILVCVNSWLVIFGIV